MSLDDQTTKKGIDTSKQHAVKVYVLEDMYQSKIVWQTAIENHMFFRVANQQGLKVRK